MYKITTETQVMEYPNRETAIVAAKEMTLEGPEVVVTDESGREELTYRRGALDRYEYETRPRRK